MALSEMGVSKTRSLPNVFWQLREAPKIPPAESDVFAIDRTSGRRLQFAEEGLVHGLNVGHGFGAGSSAAVGDGAPGRRREPRRAPRR